MDGKPGKSGGESLCGRETCTRQAGVSDSCLMFKRTTPAHKTKKGLQRAEHHCCTDQESQSQMIGVQECSWQARCFLYTCTVVGLVCTLLLANPTPLQPFRIIARFSYTSIDIYKEAAEHHLPLKTSNAVLPTSPGVSRPPPLELKLPPELLRACSAKAKAALLESTAAGVLPPLLDMSARCPDIQACSATTVSQLAETYRSWKQDDFLSLLPCDLFRYLQGRTLWVIGDSQQSYFYHQLACFLRPFAASPNASVYTPALRDPSLNGQLRKRLAGDCEQFECRGRNNTFCCAMGKGAWCLPLLGGARVCHVRANRLEQFLDRVLPHFGLLGAKRRDYVVLNAGLWHGLKDDNYINRVKQVVRHYVQHRDRLPTFIWRDVSPQHFMIGGATGEYPDSVPGARSTLATINMTCGPTEGVQLRSDGTLLGDNLEVLQGGQRNALVAPIIRQAGVSYLGIWNHSVPLHFMHKAGECTHFCSPGPYSVWIWRLWRLLAELPRRS